jgi:soluble lytic murein transglycosylase
VAVRIKISFSFLVLLFLSASVLGQTHKKDIHKKDTHKKKTAASQKKSTSAAGSATKLRHINRAFIASADLKPMAQQLLENRTPEAYAGVQDYAHRHRKDDAGPLAWTVLGYAHYLDKDYGSARESWQHAEEISPLLGDYLDFLRASAWQGEGNQEEVIKTLEGFEQKYPDSLNLHDVSLLYANALIATNQGEKAAAFLEKHRQPGKADIELALGRAYAKANDAVKAAAIFHSIYFEMPTSPEADLAVTELRGLGEPTPVGTFEQRRLRADLLFKARRYQDTVNELSPLLEQAPPDKMGAMQAQYGAALYKARKRDDAQHLFENLAQNQSADNDVKAQALYFLAEVSRDKDDRDKHADYVAQLRNFAPDSPWFQEALLSAGNMYMLKNDFESGAKFYAEIYQRQQNGRFSPYAHWKTAWLSYRLGKKDDAKRLFEEQLTFYPTSNEIPAAIYWRARIAEDEGDKAVARAYYEKLSENYRYYYYANLARARLAKLGFDEAGTAVVLAKLPAVATPPRNWDAPEDNVHVQKAQLLANAALYDFAVKELQSASAGSPAWLAKSLAEIYGDQGSYIRAIESLKRAVPGYFSAEVSQIPRPVWAGLFPRPFWDELRQDATANHLDPYLVASLIRQESEFNPNAISRANAMGLMQLLPTVGKGLAKEMKIRHFSSDELLMANTNLQLGTRYFKHMVDHYDGQVEYALAAYNAGEDRVDDWRKNGNFKSVEEFVESIPFTETREYVQAIMRNAVLYKLLYPSKADSKSVAENQTP